MRIQLRKSGSASVIAASMASNVARLTLLANSEASSGSLQARRRLTITASPLTPFIAAAQLTATVGQAASSASYAARRTAGSASLASPRAIAIGRRRPPTSACSCEVTSPCSWVHAADPVVASSAYSASWSSGIWCSARAARRRSGPVCSATTGLTSASASTPSAATHAARRARSGRILALVLASSLANPAAVASRLSVLTLAWT